MLKTKKEVMAGLVSIVSLNEVYRGAKNPKKPQVAVGDIREIIGIIATQMAKDPQVTAAMIDAGVKRLSKEKK